MKFPVGTKFTLRGKTRKGDREATVVDYHVTRNLAGDVVKSRYVAQYDFCGQTMTDSDIVGTTIARNLLTPLV